MDREKTIGWVKRIITGLVLLASNLIFGMALGLLWVKLFVPPKAMGWDGIADALGGAMVGAFLGLVITALVVIFLSVRVQWIWIGIVVVVAGVIIAGLRLTAPEREETSQPILKKDFQPFFRINYRINHTQEILSALPSDQRPFPFTEAEIFSGKPELIQVDWNPGFERCIAVPSEADLEALLPKLQDVIATTDNDSSCRTPEDDLKLSVRWNLAGETGSQGLDAGCLPDRPELTALADAIGTLADRLCDTEAGGNGSR